MRRVTGWTFVGVPAVGLYFGLGMSAYQPGIDPPSGPVSSTSPSLGDLENDISSIQSGVDGLSGDIAGVQQTLDTIASSGVGPWESAVFTPTGSSQYSATQIAAGRVFVHKIIAKGAYVVLFDGAGSISSQGNVTNGSAAAAVNFGDSDPASGHVLDIEVDNGLWIAWQDFFEYNTITVLYKPQ